MSNTFFCLLSHESIMSITGMDSKKFLQGQLTCNLSYLSSENSSLAACCTSKGRMISSFRIIEKEPNHYLLAIDQSLFDKQRDVFKKYAIFSKIVLEDVTQSYSRIGLTASTQTLSFLKMAIPEQINQVTHSENRILIKISQHRFELWVKTDQLPTIQEDLAKNLTIQPLNNWLLWQIQDGIGQVFLETSEKFVPQMINLQSLGGVSFKKGCYIGQEIVARMQYLGKLKQHLYRFSTTTNELPPKGTALLSNVHATSVGEVVLAAKAEKETVELLAVVRDDAAVADLRLDNMPTQLLKQQAIPYEVNYEEEIKH